MLDLDLDQFWKDNELARLENCFSQQAPQVAMGIMMSDECVFAELDEPGNPWGTLPRQRRLELNKRYNDKAEKIVGRRLLSENIPFEDECFAKVKQIGEVFGGQYVDNGNSVWLESDCSTPQQLEKLLDHVDRLDLREFILPSDWDVQKNRIFQTYCKKPQPLRHVRGPVTLATSIIGIENLIYLIYDEPDMALRFSKSIARVIIDIAKIMDVEAGKDPKDSNQWFSFADDNCYLLTAEMYDFFAFPILQEVFGTFCPEPDHIRFQHSDSPMSHLLPILSRLNFTGVNFGPTVLVDEIRTHMPKTRIDGCLAPFTFMNNDEQEIIREVKRDCEMAKQLRGLNLFTAGSINNGSLLTSMRTVMAAIQNYGRY